MIFLIVLQVTSSKFRFCSVDIWCLIVVHFFARGEINIGMPFSFLWGDKVHAILNNFSLVHVLIYFFYSCFMF